MNTCTHTTLPHLKFVCWENILSICLEIRKQFAKIGSLLPCGFQGSNSGPTVWEKEHLPAKLFSLARFCLHFTESWISEFSEVTNRKKADSKAAALSKSQTKLGDDLGPWNYFQKSTAHWRVYPVFTIPYLKVRLLNPENVRNFLKVVSCLLAESAKFSYFLSYNKLSKI